MMRDFFNAKGGWREESRGGRGGGKWRLEGGKWRLKGTKVEVFEEVRGGFWGRRKEIFGERGGARRGFEGREGGVSWEAGKEPEGGRWEVFGWEEGDTSGGGDKFLGEILKGRHKFSRGGRTDWTGKGRELFKGERGRVFGSENEEVFGWREIFGGGEKVFGGEE